MQTFNGIAGFETLFCNGDKLSAHALPLVGQSQHPVCGKMLCRFALKYLLRILFDTDIQKLQNIMVDKLTIEDTDSVCEIKPLWISTEL